MNLGLADVSYMSIFNDFDKAVTYDRDMIHDRKIADFFSMLIIDSTIAHKHKSIVGTGTNDLVNDTEAYTAFTLTMCRKLCMDWQFH